jgi:hypothetical protein
MFGGGGAMMATDPGPVAGMRFLLELAQLLVDRQGVADQISQFIEERSKAARLIAEFHAREITLAGRERELMAQQQALLKRENDAVELEQRARFQLRRAEEAMASLKEMRAELKQKLAA